MAELTEKLIRMRISLQWSRPEVVHKRRKGRDKGKRKGRKRKRKTTERKRKRKKEGRERRRTRRKKTEKRAEEQDRKAQLQLAKINADIEIACATKPKLKDSSREFLSKGPKMAPFSESKCDSMDAFIFRFEMRVKSYDWSDDQKFWFCQIFSLEDHFEFCRPFHWNKKTTTV